MTKTVLVIDDDAEFRASLKAVLTESGYKALEAADGATAAKVLETTEGTIDLMIVDLALPDTNGLDIIGSVSRRESPLKIIATTAVFDDVYLEMSTSVGADAGVRKPRMKDPQFAEVWLAAVRRLLGTADLAVERPGQRVILLVDDEPGVRTLVRTILQQAGYQVLEACDGLDGLSLLQRLSGAIDLLITDIRMPRMDGVQLANAVQEAYPKIPVMFISGLPLDNDAIGAGETAATRMMLRKPFLPSALLKAVRPLLQKTSADA